jgi:hypothetical protein
LICSQVSAAAAKSCAVRGLEIWVEGRFQLSTTGTLSVLTVSEKLDIPLRERNVLLLASGYAPIYNECAWKAPEMKAVTKAIDRVLLQHEPHLALVLDRYWNVIRTNEVGRSRFYYLGRTVSGQALNLNVSRGTAKCELKELGQASRSIGDEELGMLARSSVKLDSFTVPCVVYAESVVAG